LRADHGKRGRADPVLGSGSSWCRREPLIFFCWDQAWRRPEADGKTSSRFKGLAPRGLGTVRWGGTPWAHWGRWENDGPIGIELASLFGAHDSFKMGGAFPGRFRIAGKVLGARAGCREGGGAGGAGWAHGYRAGRPPPPPTPPPPFGSTMQKGRLGRSAVSSASTNSGVFMYPLGRRQFCNKAARIIDNVRRALPSLATQRHKGVKSVIPVSTRKLVDKSWQPR